MNRLNSDFFARDCLEVAPQLVGKIVAHALPNGEVLRLRIAETEAYCGQSDSACHAYHGKTARNQLLWAAPGTAYIYLCYGIHWLLNVITGQEGQPQGVLIRACVGFDGPGKLTKQLQISGVLNGADLLTSQELWLEDDGCSPALRTDTRVGISYALPADQARLWRFCMCKDN